MSDIRKPVLLIMDGWGWREEKEANAVRLARTPVFDRLWSEHPRTLIEASQHWVGLPDGQMGNSEVGHLNIGAGRIVYQDIVRIDRAVSDGSFVKNPVLLGAMKEARGHALHLMGLLSDGGVHSHQNHLHALLDLAKSQGVTTVYVHAIMDGRDTAPHGGREYLARLQAHMDSIGLGRIATVIGRYWAMDRDKRWDRTKRAYDLYTRGDGARAASAGDAIEKSYATGVTDEFVEPVAVAPAGQESAVVKDGDAIIFFNFRADRARQITRAFTDENFDGFERKPRPRVHYTCMSRYDESFTLPVVFAPESRTNILVDTAAAADKKTLRIAETEKYAHVTYFFNGGEEVPFPGETRRLIPSPKVATYDLQPEMSAAGVCETLISEIKGDQHDYFICNFANPDMVGHTGVLEAAIKACETVDACVGRVLAALDPARHVAIVTADHGNAELMLDPRTGGPHTAHTTSPVPCILVDSDYRAPLIDDGSLRDLAPTILNYLGVSLPAEMTGRDLRAKR